MQLGGSGWKEVELIQFRYPQTRCPGLHAAGVGYERRFSQIKP